MRCSAAVMGWCLMVDEFGGIAGLATLKQLLEVIVGQVGEEGDAPDQPYTPVDKDTYRLDAGIAVSEINEDLHLGLPRGGLPDRRRVHSGPLGPNPRRR